MNRQDKIISALYLAKSDNREKMLADLIQNVLYIINDYADIEKIIEVIEENFYLEPIKYEAQECIDFLIEKKELIAKNNKYILDETSYSKIHQVILKGQDESAKRFNSFNQIVRDIFDGIVTEEEIKILWSIFNEYLLECFMVFGKKAIDIFLPYKQDSLTEDDDIVKEAFKKLNSDKLIIIFKKLVIEYPERLTETELRHLISLASRAEKFYSLGIEKEEYEAIKNLQIKDLVVLVDTNVLYSVLNLRVHQENAAIFELIRIAKEKQIDLRLVYLPKTYSELQKVKTYLDNIISKENFRVPHIKALLSSEKLDPFARKFYESKLNNSELRHPSEKVSYASDFLKSQNIIIYNNRFPKLEEDSEYLKNRIIEYVDFEKYYNKLCDEKGYDCHLNKDDKKIEHDVFLREGVKILKSKFCEENELRFICLTLDRSLIHFDHYLLCSECKEKHKPINPNFILPSLFIKKIRPFIPITTNDYRKAFISSLTAPHEDFENDKDSVQIQKTMTYFKNLGIDDEEVILNLIKRELFLEEFEKHEKQNDSEIFIKSEIAKEIERIKNKSANLETELEAREKITERIIKKNESEKESILKENESKVSKLESTVSQKNEIIQKLEDRIKLIEEERRKEKEEKIAEQQKSEIVRINNDWNVKMNNFIFESWENEKKTLCRKTWYFLFVLFVTICPIVFGFVLKASNDLVVFIEKHGIKAIYIWIFLIIIFLIEVFGRAYIFDKEKVKSGWRWFSAQFNKKRYQTIQNAKEAIFRNEFIQKNGNEPQI